MHHRSHDWGPASSGGSASGGSASLGACLQGRWADPGTRKAGGMHPTGIHSYLIRIFAVYIYRPQRSWGKVIFSEACVNNSVHRGVCMVARGGVCGCSWGACLVALGGHVWLLQGGHAWLLWGARVVAPRGCAWDTTRYGDTINERAVRILLECILLVLALTLGDKALRQRIHFWVAVVKVILRSSVKINFLVLLSRLTPCRKSAQF